MIVKTTAKSQTQRQTHSHRPTVTLTDSQSHTGHSDTDSRVLSIILGEPQTWHEMLFTRPVSAMSTGRYIQISHFNGFFVFFQYLCEYVIHWNKRHIFLCLFVFLLTITGRNEAIIVELKVFCFEWHFYHLFRGFPSLDFSQLWKMVPSLAFNPVFVATSAWWGKWNRHGAVALSDYFFTQMLFF